MSAETDYTHEPEHDHLLDHEFFDDEFESGEDEDQGMFLDEDDEDEQGES